MECLIYDFETFGTEPTESVVLSCAMLVFDMKIVMGKGPSIYDYDELLKKTKFFKFDVQDQVQNHGRKIDKNTLKWWGEQTGESAKAQYVPSKNDQPISEFHDWFKSNMPNALDRVYTRGNTFDPPFVKYIFRDVNDKPEPYPFWVMRDTRSVIEGLTWGQKIKDSFIPDYPGLKEKFDAHDPRHDICMDVMRIQYLSGLILGDEIPF